MRARIDVDAERNAAAHGHRERLRAAHAAEPGGDHEAAAQAAAESLARHRLEGLEGALQDALGADVDPRPRGHLPVHRQPHGLEAPELLPGRPARHQQRVGDQHARRHLVRAGDRRPACPTAPAASRRRAASGSDATMASKHSHERAARPVPPYTTSESGSSATSGSRLFMRQRSGASVCQLPQLSVLPRGARTGRAPAVIAASPRRSPARRATRRRAPTLSAASMSPLRTRSASSDGACVAQRRDQRAGRRARDGADDASRSPARRPAPRWRAPTRSNATERRVRSAAS